MTSDDDIHETECNVTQIKHSGFQNAPKLCLPSSLRRTSFALWSHIPQREIPVCRDLLRVRLRFRRPASCFFNGIPSEHFERIESWKRARAARSKKMPLEEGGGGGLRPLIVSSQFRRSEIHQKNRRAERDGREGTEEKGGPREGTERANLLSSSNRARASVRARGGKRGKEGGREGKRGLLSGSR